MTVTRSCEVCGETAAKEVTRYSPPAWPLVACNGCNFVYLSQVPDYDELAEELAWEKTHAQEAQRRLATFGGRLDAATRWRLGIGKIFDKRKQKQGLGASGNILDVGCGGDCRVPEGATPYGIEISAELARLADPLFRARGGRVHYGPAVEGIASFSDVSFDAILMRSYLEHETRPRVVLEQAFRALKPGGRIFLRLPNYDCANRKVMGRSWCGFRFPDHVNYFTSATLRRLAEDIGYKYHDRNRVGLFNDNLMVVLSRP